MKRLFASPYLWTWVTFAALWAGLLTWFAPEFPPKPFYHRAGWEADLIPMENDVPYAWEFEAPGANIEAIYLMHAFSDKKAEVTVRVENRTQGTTLLETTTGHGLTLWEHFKPGNEAGDVIRVTYEILVSRKDRWPNIVQGLRRAEPDKSWEHGLHSDAYHFRYFIGGEEVDEETFGQPFFFVRYDQSFRWLRWFWPGALAAFFLVFARNPGFRSQLRYLLALALLVAVTSLLAYFKRFEHHWGFSDPDFYAQCAHNYLVCLQSDDPAEIEAAKTWLREYRNGAFPLVPVILAGLFALGLPTLPAYAWLAGCASFATLLLAHWLARTRFELSSRTVLVFATVLACHALFLQAFARPSTDPVRFLFVLAGIAFLIERWRRPFSLIEEAGYGLFLFLMAIAGPPGPISSAFFGLGALGIEAWRRRERGVVLPVLRSASLCGGLSLALLLICYFGCGLIQNVEVASEFYKTRLSGRDLTTVQSVAVSVISPILFFFWRGYLRMTPAVYITAAWIVYFLAMFLFIPSCLYLRVFFPVMVPILLIAAVGLQALLERYPKSVAAASSVFGAGSIVSVIWLTTVPLGLPDWINVYVYF